MIKKLVFYCCSLLICLAVQAQEMDEKKYGLTTNVSTDGLSLITLLDPYLSPLNYSGLGYASSTLNRHFLSPDQPDLSTQSSSSWLLGATFNPTLTATTLYYNQNFGRGFHYHLRPQEGMQLLLGGVMDLDLGIKQNSRNVNNAYNLDLSSNLNLSALLLYDFSLFKRTMQVQFKLESPLMGCMFVPLQGASYYELLMLGDLSNSFHYSSLHNRQGLDESISLDVPFNHSVWRFGLHFQDLKYKANDMVFRRSSVGFVVGTTFDFVTFAGRKNRAPKNFISPNR